MELPIIKYRFVFFLLSGVLVLVSIVSLAVFRLQFGLEFTGGSLLEMTFTQERPPSENIREALKETELGALTIQAAGDKNVVLRFKNVDEPTHQKVLEKLKTLGEGEEQRFTTIGPVIGEELRRTGVTAVGLGLLAILLYIAWAFRKVSRPVPSWQYGFIAAAVAMFHDVVIPLGAFSLLGKFRGEEIGVPFIAALLTILGFSVHDTIVVFDRTRENLRRYAGEEFSHIVHRSTNQTIGRSLATSFTVLATIAVIYVLGGETIRSFALALFIGIALGTYSSIFVASPLLVEFQKMRMPKFRISRPRFRRR